MERDLELEFATFVDEHRERAVRMAWRLVGAEGGAAEDVAQEAFVRAYRALGRFRGDASLNTWFTRILLNEAHRHRRWRAVRRRFSAADAEPEQLAAPDVPMRDPGLQARIAAALERLPRTQREAFVLVHLEGVSVREVAGITKRAEGTVKTHLHRALRSLRAELGDLAPGREESNE